MHIAMKATILADDWDKEFDEAGLQSNVMIAETQDDKVEMGERIAKRKREEDQEKEGSRARLGCSSSETLI